MSGKLLEECAEFFQALSNPVRLRIVEMLGKKELCQCEIIPKIGLSQSVLSSYLSQLVRARILVSRREGQRKIYSIADAQIIKILAEIRALVTKMRE